MKTTKLKIYTPTNMMYPLVDKRNSFLMIDDFTLLCTIRC